MNLRRDHICQMISSFNDLYADGRCPLSGLGALVAVLSPKEKSMTIAWKNRKVNLIVLAACLGMAAAGFVSTQWFSPVLSPASDGQRARLTEYVIPMVSPSNLFPEATAAMPGTSLNGSFASGSDSRLDDYRLERDSCCIGN